MTISVVQKNNGSLRSNTKLLTVKTFAKEEKWQFGLSEVSLMMFLWWKLCHEVLRKQGSGHQSQKHGRRNL